VIHFFWDRILGTYRRPPHGRDRCTEGLRSGQCRRWVNRVVAAHAGWRPTSAMPRKLT
jgi:sterol desaturase/sphingolipid hydroxylase (fatty acid hydroxylase superfamily)